MGHSLTVVSEDGEWKAEIRAWKNYFIFYASIGSEVHVYHREKTRNIWGQSTIDWVSKPAAISITNVYGGTFGSGGMGEITRSTSFNGGYCELKELATGFFVIDITTGDPGGGAANLTLGSVVGRIGVGTGSGFLGGSVSASSIISDPFWG